MNDFTNDFTTQKESVRIGIKILYCRREEEIQCVSVSLIPAESAGLPCLGFCPISSSGNGSRLGSFVQYSFCLSKKLNVFISRGTLSCCIP